MVDAVDVVIVVLVEVVAAVDDPVMTVGIFDSEVVNVGIPGNEPAVTLPLVFRVDSNFFEASSHEIVSSDRFPVYQVILYFEPQFKIINWYNAP